MAPLHHHYENKAGKKPKWSSVLDYYDYAGCFRPNDLKIALELILVSI